MLIDIVIEALRGGILIFGFSRVIEWLVVKRVMDNPVNGGVVSLIATWALFELAWTQFDGERHGVLPIGLDGLLIALLFSFPTLYRRHLNASGTPADF